VSFFVETVMSDFIAGEGVDQSRFFGSEQVQELVRYVEQNGGAISFFGYFYYNQNRDIMSAAPIQNSQGSFVSPTQETILDGSYNPLIRTIYMNLLNDGDRLAHTVPFLRFGLMQRHLVSVTGYVPVSEESAAESVQRLEQALSVSRNERTPARQAGIAVGTIVGVLVIIGIGIAAVLLVRRKLRRQENTSGHGPEKDCSSGHGPEEQPLEYSDNRADRHLLEDVVVTLSPSAWSFEELA
jgi:hypothetical protein